MIAIAKQAALAAGEILLQHFGNIPDEMIRRKSQNDFLSFVDEESERAIIETIRSRYPRHSFLAEEGGSIESESPYRWIIDPLDGTKNYLSGIPVFAVSIAMEYEGKLVLGIIYDPVHNEMFRAEQGKGAWLNNVRLQVSAKSGLQESLIATGFPFKAKQFLPQYLKSFEEIFTRCIGIRRAGAAAIDLAWLAAGRFDGFWELGLQPWDVAAGAVLIREAGGKISDFWDGEGFLFNHYLVAGNSAVHEELTDVLGKHFKAFQNVY